MHWVDTFWRVGHRTRAKLSCPFSECSRKEQKSRKARGVRGGTLEKCRKGEQIKWRNSNIWPKCVKFLLGPLEDSCELSCTTLAPQIVPLHRGSRRSEIFAPKSPSNRTTWTLLNFVIATNLIKYSYAKRLSDWGSGAKDTTWSLGAFKRFI